MGLIDEFAIRFREGIRATLFRVTGNIPKEKSDNQQRMFFIKAASMPASTSGVVEVPFLGRRIKLPGDRTFAEWTCTVMMDEDNQIRNDFERWMDHIGSHSNIFHSSVFGAPDPGELRQDWNFEALKSDNLPYSNAVYTLKNCFPTEVGAAEFSYENNDTMVEVSVTLQSAYWTNAASAT